ncbi:MAG: GNAT family N-acetyltransferase [Xanthomonadaceae bacterium]|nr:GNAT family N-acetyltransferase [Xanthomonadaceae bacterium]
MLETERLTLRRFAYEDAAFIVELLNDPSFIENIADKGVRTLDDARRYLDDGPLASYAAHGFGLWRVGLKADDTPIGMCGLLKRDALDDPDIGYAFLPRYAGRGYAHEAAAATLACARDAFGLRRVVAIVSAGNARSIGLLGKLGFAYEREVLLPHHAAPIPLYGWRAEAVVGAA